MDGSVLHTTSSLKSILGFPGTPLGNTKVWPNANIDNMWVGRSFIDYVMPEDQQEFCRWASGNMLNVVEGGEYI